MLPARAHAADCGLTAGPDVIVGDIFGFQRWGQANGATAFTFAPTLCNIGTSGAVFESNSNQHPITVHNLYQWKPLTPGADHGSFRQIGMSWASHHFFALSNNMCCDDCVPTNGTTLGVKCSSPESASIMGSAFVLGPRSEINPVTGDFPFIHASASGDPTLAGRVQANDADLDQADALNADSAYAVENLTISPDDAINGAGNNNASHRPVTVSSTGSVHSIALSGATAESPAIMAWGDIEPGVLYSTIDAPGDGRFIIASNASDDDGDGVWRYEYAVYNMNSDEATAGFTVPVPAGVAVSNIAMHDIDHHSGEIYDTADWPGVRTADAVHWEAPAFSPATDRNAIRWGTLFSFGFDADAEPEPADTTLILFASGSAAPVVSLKAPRGSVCVTDLNGDGVTDTADLGVLISAFGSHGATPADLNGDGAVDTADLGILIGAFGTSCP
jgi:hypothetical protein